MSELSPCPFCGGKAEIRAHQDGCAAWIACTCCGGQSGGFQDCGLPMNALKDRAIDEWNRRKADSDQIDRLKAAINWCIERDDRNGSMPEAYREKLLSVLE